MAKKKGFEKKNKAKSWSWLSAPLLNQKTGSKLLYIKRIVIWCMSKIGHSGSPRCSC